MSGGVGGGFLFSFFIFTYFFLKYVRRFNLFRNATRRAFSLPLLSLSFCNLSKASLRMARLIFNVHLSFCSYSSTKLHSTHLTRVQEHCFSDLLQLLHFTPSVLWDCLYQENSRTLSIGTWPYRPRSTHRNGSTYGLVHSWDMHKSLCQRFYGAR